MTYHGGMDVVTARFEAERSCRTSSLPGAAARTHMRHAHHSFVHSVVHTITIITVAYCSYSCMLQLSAIHGINTASSPYLMQIQRLERVDLIEEHRQSDEDEMCSYNAKESCHDDGCHGFDKSTCSTWAWTFPKFSQSSWLDVDNC